MKSILSKIGLLFSKISSEINHPVYFLILTDILLSNVHRLFYGCYTHSGLIFNSLYHGDVEYWVMAIANHLRGAEPFAWIFLSNYFDWKLTKWRIFLCLIYAISVLKDSVDFVVNGNVGTIGGDAIVMVVGIITMYFLFRTYWKNQIS